MRLPVDDWQFPDDWQVVPASKLAEFTRGISWRKADKAPPHEGVQVVSIPNIKNGTIDFDSKFNHYISKTITEAKRLRIGDIVFVGSSGSIHNVGRNALVTTLPAELVSFASFTFKARRIDGQVDNNFLYYLLNSQFSPFDLFCKRAADGKFNFQLRQFTSELRVPLPPPEEQRQIALVLATANRAVEQQQQLIARTQELKDALMQELFTRGLRGEQTKDSEIGEVPMSWGVLPLGKCLAHSRYGMSVKGESTGRYPILRMTNQVKGKISPQDLQWIDISDDNFRKFRVQFGDLLFNRTNSFDLVGRTAVFDITGDYVFASYLIRLRTVEDRLNPFFLNHYFNWANTQARLKTIATRAVSQSNISATRLKGFHIPIPPIGDQAEIIRVLDVLDTKMSVHERWRDTLQSLYSTLLNELMAARVRTIDLDLSALPVEISGSEEIA